jgi:tellurite resistance protein TehA-like permease
MAAANPHASPPPQTRVEVLGNLGPNWFASVMGTGIVATAGATLPVHVVGLRVFAQVVWVIAAALLMVLIVLVGGHW